MSRVIFALLFALWLPAQIPNYKPNPPFAVQVQGQVWKIELVEKVDLGDGETYDGYTFFANHVIEIDKHENPCEISVTLTHELMHAAVGENFSTADMAGHTAIYRLSAGMAPILSGNPELLHYYENVQRWKVRGGQC